MEGYNMAKRPRVRIDARTTTRYGDDYGTDEILARNHDASKPRSMKNLRLLLCKSGDRSDGKVCYTCDSVCQFGIEYMRRKDSGD